MWLISKNPGETYGKVIGGKSYSVGGTPVELPDEIAKHFTDAPLPIAAGPKRSDLSDFIGPDSEPETPRERPARAAKKVEAVPVAPEKPGKPAKAKK